MLPDIINLQNKYKKQQKEIDDLKVMCIELANRIVALEENQTKGDKDNE